MTYLDRLKVRISEKSPAHQATEATKGAFVPFVAPSPPPLSQISAANDHKSVPIPAEIARLINGVMQVADCSEVDRLAFADDWRADPEGAEAAFRHLISYYGESILISGLRSGA